MKKADQPKVYRSTIPRLSSGDSLTFYISEINKHPLLDPADELKYARAWKTKNDRNSANALIQSHLRLVVKIASQYRGYGLPMHDIIAEGNLGLMKSLKNFDPEKGFRFSTYAMWWIKAEIKEYVLNSWSMVKIGTTRAQKKLFFSLRRLKRQVQTKFTHNLTPEQKEAIAIQLDVSAIAVDNMEKRLGSRDFSLNTVVRTSDGEGDDIEWQERLVDESADHESDLIYEDHMSKQRYSLAQALGLLNEREYKILTNRQLSDSPKTLEKLGSDMGLSRERIRQIEAAAFKKVKKVMLNVQRP